MKRVLLTTQTDSIELGPGNHVIGRDLGCQLRFNDSSVSRRHVRIEVALDRVTAEDLGSRNGTYVNGRLLVAPQPLRGGEEIRIGRRVFRVTVVDAVDEATDERTATDPRGAEALRRFAGLFVPERNSTVPPPPPAPTHVTCSRCREAVPLAAEKCPQCGHTRRARTLGVTQPLLLSELMLEPADAPLGAERRRSPRFHLSVPVIYISPNLMLEALGTDLSAHGIFIATELFEAPGTACGLTLLPDGGSALHLTGKIARVVEREEATSSVGMGIEFEALDPISQEALARMLGREAPPSDL